MQLTAAYSRVPSRSTAADQQSQLLSIAIPPSCRFATLFVFLSWEPFGTAPGNVYNLMLAVVLLIVITISSCFTFYQELSTSRVLAGFKGK